MENKQIAYFYTNQFLDFGWIFPGAAGLAARRFCQNFSINA
jgi:hypothetical protein